MLHNLSLSLKVGELLALLGPSGCGKSTLLRILAGLDACDSGNIVWQGSPQFGFVFQDAELLAWRSVLENVRLPLELQKNPGSTTETNAAAEAALQKVGLEESLRLFPHELSGGMKMRVSIARALVASPKVLFMDEPFAALDEMTRFKLQNQLRSLCESEGLSLIFVTHSSSEAVYLADRILLMSSGGGEFILNRPLSYQIRDDAYRASPLYQSIVSEISHELQGSFR